jgi:NhaP-type Na+/H+ or K+/H+ antiporter
VNKLPLNGFIASEMVNMLKLTKITVMCGAMGGYIDLKMIQCLVFSAIIVAVDPVAVSTKYIQ